MEGQQRLTGIEGVSQLAHAALTAGELLQDAEPLLVAERLHALNGQEPVGYG